MNRGILQQEAKPQHLCLPHRGSELQFLSPEIPATLSVFHKHHTSHINLYKINHAERIPPQETYHASTKERHQAASVSRIRSGLLKTQMAPNTSVPLKVLPLYKDENCVPGSVITHLTV